MSNSAYPDASDALEALLMPYTLRFSRDGDSYTSRCGLSTTTVAVRENVNGRDQTTFAHVLKLPIDYPVILQPGEYVTLDNFPGETYRVIGSYHSNLRLTRRYTVTEAR